MQPVGFTPIPDRISRLAELAYNLWWTWHPEAQELFRRIDAPLWEKAHHNPVLFLQNVRQSSLDSAANDPEYLRAYHEILIAFGEYTVFDKTWFKQNYGDKLNQTIAYFSAEFGLHECLPIYSGGLGILSGDHTKAASDLGLPLIGVGFLYPQGYFNQEITATGDQEAIYQKVRFSEVPAQPAFTLQGKEVVISVSLPTRGYLPERRIYAKVYHLNVGNVSLYLLDTDIHPNASEDRNLSARLYGGDEEMRLAQEKILGLGGVRALQKLGITPSVFHMNEGHSAFLVFERMRCLIDKGCSFQEAQEKIRQTTVFTTHTPIAAGHDAFPLDMMSRYFPNWHEFLGISRDELLNLGRQEQHWGPTFSMTVLALRLSGYHNGVSQLHGDLSRNMWHWLWPDDAVENVPITHITNGVHTETWIYPKMKAVFDKYMGKTWPYQMDNPIMWEMINNVPDELLWKVINQGRGELIDFIRNRVRKRLARLQMGQHELEAINNLLDPNILTIGFARRFATYKRATLLFHDTERLKRIVYGNGERPVQFVFAGKAHPLDEPGKNFIREVYHRSQEWGLVGRLVMLENYDINIAREMFAGVDVWQNTPLRPMEASGTSGQKAAVNGKPNLSIFDGWWAEGYNGKNGWVIGDYTIDHHDEHSQNHADATSLYDLLEYEVVPAFYERDESGIPRRWIALVKETIRSCAPQFCTFRMVKEYTKKMYIPCMERGT